MRPAKVGPVTVTSQRTAATVRWQSPANWRATGRLTYRVALSKPNSTRYRRPVTVPTRAVTFRRMQRKATYRVSIRAVNAAGAGPATTKVFRTRR